MGKTFKRNQYHKPKQHGRTFEKKRDKWSKKQHPPKEPDEQQLEYDLE